MVVLQKPYSALSYQCQVLQDWQCEWGYLHVAIASTTETTFSQMHAVPGLCPANGGAWQESNVVGAEHALHS